MGCKSPVGEPLWETIIKPLAEGKGGRVTDRPKEAGVQNREPTNRNVISRPSLRVSQHDMVQPVVQEIR